MSNTVAWIPGTVGPDPAYLPSPEKEAANYREMADTLAEAGCDLLAMEMIMDVERASRATEAALATGLPVWVGISTSRGPGGAMVGWDVASEEEGRLPEGYEPPVRERLETIIDALTSLGPQATGIMHSSVESTTPGLEVLFERWNGPVMAYPRRNAATRGLTLRVSWSSRRISPHTAGAGWRAAFRIIGGCCGTTIRHIRAMVNRLPDRPGPRLRARDESGKRQRQVEPR